VLLSILNILWYLAFTVSLTVLVFVRQAPRLFVVLCALLNERIGHLHPFSVNSRTATVPKVFQIGLCGVVEGDMKLFCNSWSAGVLGERLYAAATRPNPTRL